MKMKSVIAGRVHRAARARPHDQADLRHHARRQHVALEHLGIAAERGDALLDACPAAVVQPDHRRADLERHVHDLADLLRVAFAQAAAEHGEVLAEDEHQPAVDRPRAGYNAVARDLLRRHAEVDAIMLDIHVELLEARGIEQHVEPLARRQPALLMLRVDASLTAAHARRLAPPFEFNQCLQHQPILSVAGLSAVSRG